MGDKGLRAVIRRGVFHAPPPSRVAAFNNVSIFSGDNAPQTHTGPRTGAVHALTRPLVGAEGTGPGAVS